MVAKISTGKDLYGALAYNQTKVENGHAKILDANLLPYPEDGRFRMGGTLEAFTAWLPSHYRTEKPVIHISLNPHPDDVLTDGQLAAIGREYMEKLGYGNQPFLIFKHEDIDRHHIHIVSLRVDSGGRKISDRFEHRRSKEITGQLEQKYRLHPAEGQKKAEEWKLRPVDAAKGDIRRQIADTVKPLLKLYRFQSMGEFRALLSLYNIGMEEVRGEAGGRAYHGIVYTALDADGNKVATPIKSARLGRMAGAEGLQRRMEWSASRIRADGCRERLRPPLAGALLKARDEADFRRRLAAMNVDLVLRRNESGRIYGVTFIDHTSRTVLNGSRLGKEFSANALEARFNVAQPGLSEEVQPHIATSAPEPDTDGKVLGGLFSAIEPETSFVPRHPRLHKPDKKKRRRRYGRQD